jgi:hypothetical protein
MKKYTLSVIVALMPFSINAAVISGVPSYVWYHGCVPTSIGMILGYWDMQGYSNLFQASGNALYSTSSVQDEISSPEYNAARDGVDTGATIPLDCIAAFLGTSKDPLGYGVSNAIDAGPATIGYAAYKGYDGFVTTNKTFSSTWSTLVNEVNAGRPMLFFVDSDGNGIYDHSVSAIGYDGNYNNDGPYYACYDTKSETENPVWYKFQPVGKIFGVYGGTTIIPGPIPELSTTIIGLFMGSLLALRRRRAKSLQ